jgi:tetratricopeptide (TPR) repeat protein
MELTPVQWESVKSLFDGALELAPETRSSYLRQACSDAGVLEEVERLLANYQEMGSFITAPAAAAFAGTANSSAPASLAAGDVLVDRFRIIQFVARGGMGEVYEAEDLELGGTVAIKTIRSDLLGAPVVGRFKKEVQLAKRVTHPNACRIYDLFRHSSAIAGDLGGEDSSPTMLFIAMEFLQGESLAARLRRGPMETGEALGIIRQVAGALDAAHTAGVLHRDLKPANVILVPPAESGAMRAVVTDFGLALRSDRGAAAASGIEGTPAYMSPEQLLGEELTPASDIYSLGLIMYQTVTGVHAFEDGERTLLGLTRLAGSPVPPRRRSPHLDRRWEAIILRCLEREPMRRYQTAREVIDALNRIATPDRRSRKIAWYAVVVAAASALAWVGIRSRMAFHDAISAAGQRAAVLGFKNESGRPEAAWISTALSTYLTADLGAGGRLEMVPDEDIGDMKADLSLMDSDVLSKEALARVRARLGASFVVLGSYLQDDKQVRLRLRMLDTMSGQVKGSVEEAAASAKVIDLFSGAGNRLRSALRLGPLTHQEEEEVHASLPSSPNASRLYSKGLEDLQRFDARAAADELQQAVTADPRFPLAHSALADAWFTLGYEQKAAAEAKAAFDVSGNLSWRDRQLIEGHYRRIARQWDMAADIYTRLWKTYPDEVDYGLHVADVQTSAGRGADALLTVEKMRTSPARVRDDPRIDLAEALATDDVKREQMAASTAARKAAASSQVTLLAAALRDEGWALNGLGRKSEAIAALTESQRIYRDLGDLGNAARANLNLASVLSGQASLASRKSMIEEVVQVFRSIGSKRGEAVALNNFAGILQDMGRPDEAERSYRRASEVCAEIGDLGRLAGTRNNLGTIAESRGDLATALSEYEAALAIDRSIKVRSNIAYHGSNVAGILRLRGDLTGALKSQDEALAIYRDLHSVDPMAEAFRGRAEVLTDQGLLALAKKDYEQALSISRKSDNPGEAALALDALAVVVMYQGDLVAAHRLYDNATEFYRKDASGVPARRRVAMRLLLEESREQEVERTARAAIQESQNARSPAGESYWRIVLARCLLPEKRTAEAQAEMDQVAALLKKSQDQVVRLDFLITSALVRAASGAAEDESAALVTLAAAIRGSRKFGFVGFNLEARLAQGEIEMRLGAPAASDDLMAAKKDADASGFGLISGKAAKALRSGPARPED